MIQTNGAELLAASTLWRCATCRPGPTTELSGEAPVSIADFAEPEKRLAIYVDGAAFQVGVNLRRNRFIRDRLRKGSPPWRVIELRAMDLLEGRSLVNRIRSA